MGSTDKSHNSHINLLISNIDRGGYELPLQFAQLYGDEEIRDNFSNVTKEEYAKELLEIISLFTKYQGEEVVLDSVQFADWEINKPNSSISHMYLTKNSLNNTYTINLLRTDQSEISLSKISSEVAFIGQAITGVYARVSMKADETENLTEEDQNEINNNLQKLGKFYDWQVADERSLMRGSEKTGLSPMLTTLFMVKASVVQDEYMCTGSCNQILNARENEAINCECGGEYRLLSPHLNMDQVSFVYPNSIEDISLSKSIEPKKMFQIVEDICIPKKLVVLLNRIANPIFGNKVILPVIANFRSILTNDSVKIIVDYIWKSEDEVYLMAYLTDTRYSHIDLISAVSLPMIIREIKESISRNSSFEDAVKKSKLKDWNQTPLLKVKQLSNVSVLSKEVWYTGEINDE
ncbi:MAG: hypothetical protein KGD64_12245 [Candidatus Heimdallarchaeota archaeon]|nr:hypothetical protein [Candidatus Heimdallarchaeota archaeon]